MNRINKFFVNTNLRTQKSLQQAKKMLDRIDLSSSKKVLDIGCGDGTISSFISKNYGLKVIGIDIDPDQIKKAKQKNSENKNLIFLQENSVNLSDNDFDLVITLNVFHHFKDWWKKLEEINRLLKKGGFLIFTGFVYTNFASNIYKSINSKIDVFTLKDIIIILNNYNYKIVCCEKPVKAKPLGGFKFEYCRGIFQK
jgi:ubiquinone/menaquinone biosynthesis C-methylase UbiE